MKRIFAVILILALVFAILPTATVSGAAPGTFNAGDIAVINAIIDNNGLNWTKADPADGSYVPEDWGIVNESHNLIRVEWSSATTNRRIIGLCVFREWLTGKLDVGGLTALTTLSCGEHGIWSGTGEYMEYTPWPRLELDVKKNTALTTLYCTNMQTLDLSNNIALKNIGCGGAETLDVSNNTALTYLSCRDGYLTELDVSKNTALKYLQCQNNQLTTLDVSNNAMLLLLDCSRNNMTSSDDIIGWEEIGLYKAFGDFGFLGPKPLVGGVVNVKYNMNMLKKLGDYGYRNHDIDTWSLEKGNLPDGLTLNTSTGLISGTPTSDGKFIFTINGCGFNDTFSDTFCITIEPESVAPLYNPGDIAVINAIIENNGLNWTKADPADGSYVPEDWEVNWSYDETDRRITGCYIRQESLTGVLDVSGLTSLHTLFFEINQLTITKLNISCTSIKWLILDNSQLTELDASGCTSLEILSCGENQLTELDVSGCTSLKQLFCY